MVLAGDSRQLQPIEAGAAFRAVAERAGVAEIGAVRRQREDWAREASEALARGEIATGLAAYTARGQERFLESREVAKATIARDYAGAKSGTSLILAHTNEDRARSEGAGARRAPAFGRAGEGAEFAAARGKREFAAEDRVVFLLNDRDLGAKNGTLGTVENAMPGMLAVRLDGGAQVRIQEAQYAQIDHGYAVTVDKAQGTTVDRTYVLASGGMDRHLAHVGLTRHREAATLYAERDDFRDEAALARRLGRARPKATSLDFAERRGIETPKPFLENARARLETRRERLREVWERAERVFAAVRERFGQKARPERAAVLREEFSTSRDADAAAENTRLARCSRLSGPARSRVPRTKSGGRAGAEVGGGARGAVAGRVRAGAGRGPRAERGRPPPDLAPGVGQGEIAGRKTPEQMRQALQEQPKPARDSSRSKGRDRVAVATSTGR